MRAEPRFGGTPFEGPDDPPLAFVIQLEAEHVCDTALKPVAAIAQSVTVIADAKDSKAKVKFETKGNALASKTRLPAKPVFIDDTINAFVIGHLGHARLFAGIAIALAHNDRFSMFSQFRGRLRVRPYVRMSGERIEALHLP
jgi:hypothetical protein